MSLIQTVFTGTSIGGIVYPIMLNQLFKTSAGFAWGVRASAFLTMALLSLSICIMKTRPSVTNKSDSVNLDLKLNLVICLTDFPFMLSICR